MANRSAAEWRRLVDEWRRSQVSRRVFAAAYGIRPQTLSWWAWRLGSEATRPEAGSPAFVEIVVADRVPTPRAEFVVEVGGVRVRVPPGFDAGELRRLVGALC